MSTDTNVKPAVTTAQAVQTKTSVVPPKPAQPETVLKPESKYKSEDFGGAPIVRLKLKQAGIMQYDSVYKLKLDSVEPTEIPLTPFFAERIGRTVELCV